MVEDILTYFIKDKEKNHYQTILKIFVTLTFFCFTKILAATLALVLLRLI